MIKKNSQIILSIMVMVTVLLLQISVFFVKYGEGKGQVLATETPPSITLKLVNQISYIVLDEHKDDIKVQRKLDGVGEFTDVPSNDVEWFFSPDSVCRDDCILIKEKINGTLSISGKKLGNSKICAGVRTIILNGPVLNESICFNIQIKSSIMEVDLPAKDKTDDQQTDQFPKETLKCSDKGGYCLSTGECKADGGISLGKLDCSINKICCKTTSSSSKNDSSIIPDYPDDVFVDKDNKGIFDNDSTIGGIFSKLLAYIYVIAGLYLLVMLIMGGLGLMTAAGNADKMKAGYGRITNALIGFLIIFISYFVVQLVETILGIKIM